MRVAIVVPCYNEAARLDGPAFVAWVDEHPDHTFLFVDDGSTDDTHAVLQALADQHDNLELLHLPDNFGKAETVRQGVLHALKQSPDAVGFWDADLATPLDEIPRFVDVLEQRSDIEIVLGSRIRLLGSHVERNPMRHYFGRMAATGVSVMLELRVYDTQCGAKLFRNTDRLPLLWNEPFVTRWVFDVELLMRWQKATPHSSRADLESHVVELPLRVWHDVAGSKIKSHEFLLAPRELLRIWRRYR